MCNLLQKGGEKQQQPPKGISVYQAVRRHKLLLPVIYCRNSKMSAVIVVHGGAWAIPDDLAEASVRGVKAAAREGSSVLHTAGSAVDAVEAAVRNLEDNSVFNAGTLLFINSYWLSPPKTKTIKKKNLITFKALYHGSLSPSAGDGAHIHVDWNENHYHTWWWISDGALVYNQTLVPD